MDRIAVITGGSKGIGRAIAKHIEGRYVTVSIGRSRDNQFICDLTKREWREGLIPTVMKYYGRVDVLINCAWSQFISPAMDYPLDEWDKQMEYLTASFELSREAKRNGATRIINIASVAGIRGARGCVGYSVAKAGVIHLTKCLSNEWGSECTVNAIAPNWVETDMLEHAFRDEAHKEQLTALIPAGRIANTSDLLPAVDFLLKADYVTGIVIPVDGGWLGR